MLECLLALAMAVEVQHEFVPMKDLNVRLEARLNDGWDVVFSSFVVASPGARNPEARMLFVFRRGAP
jgi:hypothetical protein